jgi:hypothetical protein
MLDLTDAVLLARVAALRDERSVETFLITVLVVTPPLGLKAPMFFIFRSGCVSET